MSYIKGLLALSLIIFAGTAVSINNIDANKNHSGKPAKGKPDSQAERDDSLGSIGRQYAKVFTQKNKTFFLQ